MENPHICVVSLKATILHYQQGCELGGVVPREKLDTGEKAVSSDYITNINNIQ